MEREVAKGILPHRPNCRQRMLNARPVVHRNNTNDNPEATVRILKLRTKALPCW